MEKLKRWIILLFASFVPMVSKYNNKEDHRLLIPSDL